MRADGWQEKPLQGAVVCCTAISPELRSRYADHVMQMGAEHRLDLTSDVTHLLVGHTDTPKYKYVAKEREDVKVLQPNWVEAVRERWMADEAINLNEFDVQYRVPTLAGLKICITGFDDLTFRAQLQKNVVENGGLYSGDLTKDVTHLIAAHPSGKKFEYGTQWQKKIVGLRWYKDTLERGMQLEESTYHPSVPDDEQGVGAWNRASRKAPSFDKRRQRDDSQLSEQPRKLRRTASARFSSQNDTMWNDIVENESTDDSDRKPQRLQVSRSVPDLQQQCQNPSKQGNEIAERKGIFVDKYFVLQGFSTQHETILKSVLLSHGGSIASNLSSLHAIPQAETVEKVLLLPYQTTREQIPSTHKSINVASELWVEHCMFSKKFHLPSTYPLGQFLPQIKPPGFSKLVITSTGFTGITPNHIAKMVVQLGGTYEQTFKGGAGVLICNSQSQSRQKAELALSWRIPTVSESWLWACIRDNRQAAFEKHTLLGFHESLPAKAKPSGNDELQFKEELPKKPVLTAHVKGKAKGAAECLPVDEVVNESAMNLNTNEDGIVFANEESVAVEFEPDGADSNTIREKQIPACVTEAAGQTTSDLPELPDDIRSRKSNALRSISPNLAPQRRKEEKVKPKKRLFQTFDGPGDDTENAGGLPPSDASRSTLRPTESDVQTLNGEIRELLDLKSKLKEKRSENGASNGKPRKQLMGRALSNLSNASSASHVRQSRCGSVDSVNTDGIGQEIKPSAPDEGMTRVEEPPTNPSFTGRATSKLSDSCKVSMHILAASDAGDEDGDWTEAAHEPALTQLVYEDPEEVLQSREKLAAKRRQRSRLGQKESNPKPEKTRATPAKRIKDDDLLVDAGWGAGRRTRKKEKASPPGGLKDF